METACYLITNCLMISITLPLEKALGVILLSPRSFRARSVSQIVHGHAASALQVFSCSGNAPENKTNRKNNPFPSKTPNYSSVKETEENMIEKEFHEPFDMVMILIRSLLKF